MSASCRPMLFLIFAVAWSTGCNKVGAPETKPQQQQEQKQPPGGDASKEQAKPALPVVSVTSVEFAEDHLDAVKDPDGRSKKAEARYKGKIVELTGRVTEFGRYAGKTGEIILEGAKGQVLGPICLMLDDQAPWKKYVPGQRVKLRGKARSFGKQPYLFDCEVVEANDFKLPAVDSEILAKDYSADAAAFTDKYLKKDIILSGVVVATGLKFGIIELKGDGKTKVLCGISEQDLIEGLKQGDKVRLLGKLSFAPVGDEVRVSGCWPLAAP